MTSAKSLALAFGITLATLLSTASSAQAQYGYPPPPPPRGYYRHGFLLGFGVGGGGLSASNCGTPCGGGFAGEFHIGGMVNPRLAIMGDFWGVFHPWDLGGGYSATTAHTISTFAVQYWVTPIVWLKGGGGFGRMQLIDDSGGATLGDETGFAITAAGGVEIVQSANFALDLQLRFGHGFYSGGGDVDNYAFMVGFNWY
jgi:hypothetical protein